MNAGKWYTAVLVMRSEIVGATDYVPLIDLQWRLIFASDARAAHKRAIEIGREGEGAYENEEEETVAWLFSGLHELVELDDPPADGVEVFSRLERRKAKDFVVADEDLQVFAVREIMHLTAREIIDKYEGAQPDDAADGSSGDR